MLAILLPPINPVAISLGPIQIRWYALAYIVGCLFAIFYAYYLEKDLSLFTSKNKKKKFFDDILVAIVIGIILGGRIGYVLFYNLPYYLSDLKKIFYIWEGGMSFHGAIIGCIISLYIFSKKTHIKFFNITDLLVAGGAIGIFFGRIANFINQELIGRPSNVFWAVIYNNDFIKRHPSQIYEALLEGILLFLILTIAWKKFHLYKKPGYISSIAVICYSIFRIFAEFFREPDEQIGFIFNYITMGQILSTIMLLLGIILIFYLHTYYKKHPN